MNSASRGGAKRSYLHSKISSYSRVWRSIEEAILDKTFCLLERHILPMVLAGILVFGGQATWACGNGKLLFQEKFQTIDLRWQLAVADPNRSCSSPNAARDS